MTTMLEESIGLCYSCNNSSFCNYRSKRGFDALYCETFDAFSVNGKPDDITLTKTSTIDEIIFNPTLQGLCSNCIHADKCSLAMRNGGVWHCEEFE